MRYINIIVLYVLFLSMVSFASADWSEPQSILEQANRPSIIQDSDGVYWIGFSSLEEYANIWIMNSTDGINWGNYVQVTSNNQTEYAPNLIQDSNGEYWLLYNALTDIYNVFEFNYELMLTHSPDGISWSEPVAITNSSAIDTYPYIMQDMDGRYFVTFSSFRKNSTTGHDIYVMYSDDGVAWSDEIQLTNSPEGDIFPIMLQDKAGKYWMMFTRDTSEEHPPMMNKHDVFMITSDDGIEWSDVAQVTFFSQNINYPYFLQDDDGVFWIPHMVSVTGITGSEELGLMGSRDGISWTDSKVLSNYSQEAYFKTDYKSMVQNDKGEFIWAFASAKIGRGIWIMNGTPDIDLDNTHRIKFNLTRFSEEIIDTVELDQQSTGVKDALQNNDSDTNNTAGLNSGLILFSIIFAVFLAKKD
ncbi:MAG: sialidase family protein [Methanosarcinaceae archaeon]|nr:sialidase family protein [Methanosarcinaceae archaeon]